MKLDKETKANIPLKDLAPPGVKGELVSLFVRKEENRTDQDRLHDNNERTFVLKALLSKNATKGDGLKASVNLKEGSSFLMAHEDTLHAKVETKDGTFFFETNEQNELSGVTFECVASSPLEAKAKFHNIVVPFVDYLSYLANSPIHLPLTDCWDQKNELMLINYESPYPRTTVNPHTANIIEQLRPIYALFREAKNTDSSFYKFLCYYKILEGIYKHSRPALFTEARNESIKLTTQRELIPDNPELRSSYGKVIGTPIQPFYENVLQKEYRDSIAHFLLSDGSVLNVSDYQTSSNFSNIVFITELCCKTVIENHESYYREYIKSSNKV